MGIIKIKFKILSSIIEKAAENILLTLFLFSTLYNEFTAFISLAIFTGSSSSLIISSSFLLFLYPLIK